MEKMYHLFEPDILNDDITKKFMELSINSLKDLHEENCKIWKELAELKGKQDFEFEFRGLDDKGNYVYEPNE